MKKLRTAVAKNRTEKGKHFEFRNTYYRHIVWKRRGNDIKADSKQERIAEKISW